MDTFLSILLSDTVLIVPLWNWNKIIIKLQLLIFSFNRTFMELKSDWEKLDNTKKVEF